MVRAVVTTVATALAVEVRVVVARAVAERAVVSPVGEGGGDVGQEVIRLVGGRY